MQNSKKIQAPNEESFPAIGEEELQNLRNFIEEVQWEIKNSPSLKRKKQSKKLKPRKKRKKILDERIQDLPFVF